MIKKTRRAQEEMVGFGIIVVIVSIILLIFLSFYLRGSNEIEISSYEAENFVQSVLQFTSECNEGEFLSVQDLIFSCDNDKECGEESSCETLNRTLMTLCEISWKVGEDTPVKGYEMKIDSEGSEISLIQTGNVTQNYRSGFQDFPKRGRDYNVVFKVYY